MFWKKSCFCFATGLPQQMQFDLRIQTPIRKVLNPVERKPIMRPLQSVQRRMGFETLEAKTLFAADLMGGAAIDLPDTAVVAGFEHGDVRFPIRKETERRQACHGISRSSRRWISWQSSRSTFLRRARIWFATMVGIRTRRAGCGRRRKRKPRPSHRAKRPQRQAATNHGQC